VTKLDLCSKRQRRGWCKRVEKSGITKEAEGYPDGTDPGTRRGIGERNKADKLAGPDSSVLCRKRQSALRQPNIG